MPTSVCAFGCHTNYSNTWYHILPCSYVQHKQLGNTHTHKNTSLIYLLTDQGRSRSSHPTILRTCPVAQLGAQWKGALDIRFGRCSRILPNRFVRWHSNSAMSGQRSTFFLAAQPGATNAHFDAVRQNQRTVVKAMRASGELQALTQTIRTAADHTHTPKPANFRALSFQSKHLRANSSACVHALVCALAHFVFRHSIT
jgi:hypothetical protein